MKRILTLCLASLLIFAAGCSGNARPKTAPVSGTVTFQGKPLERGTIVFDVEGMPGSKASIIDGKIVDPTTYKKGDGIPVGKAKIAVYATKAAESPASKPTNPNVPAGLEVSDGQQSAVSLIPAKYNRPETSGLSHEIGPKNNVIDLALE